MELRFNVAAALFFFINSATLQIGMQSEASCLFPAPLKMSCDMSEAAQMTASLCYAPPPGSVIPSHCHCAQHSNDRVWILASAKSISAAVCAGLHAVLCKIQYVFVFFFPTWMEVVRAEQS